jgi:hypothetical protein
MSFSLEDQLNLEMSNSKKKMKFEVVDSSSMVLSGMNNPNKSNQFQKLENLEIIKPRLNLGIIINQS